jgi:hypothetical protein
MSKLSRNSQRITNECWYYERWGGILLIYEVRINGQYIRTDHIKIPWRKLRTSLKRKDALPEKTAKRYLARYKEGLF